jgi:triosephosphate isomerase
MFLVANWKMNMTRASIDEYMVVLSESSIWGDLVGSGIRIGLAPSHVYLDYVVREIRNRDLPVMVLAQDVSTRTSGAFTGEVGIPNLLDVGVTGVVIGHSERRRFFHETDENVVVKTGLALSANMVPIVCFGESGIHRKRGKTFSVVKSQIEPVFEGIKKAREKGMGSPFYLAYEPVWAIGTGQNATPADIHEVTKYVSDEFSWPDPPAFLYGGSVSSDNIRILSSLEDLSGFLVGSAWLDPHALLHSADLVRRSNRPVREGVHVK